MSICYAIKDWNKHFENSESRKYKSLTWVPMKNKHDGKGYRRVCQHPKSIQVFCAWCLLVQVASKMPVRGILRDDDGPLTASDLAFKTGLPEFIFEEAFKVLTDPKIGWMTKEETSEIRKHPEISEVAGGEQNGTEAEQNGIRNRSLIDAKGGVQRGAAPAPPPGDRRSEFGDGETGKPTTSTKISPGILREVALRITNNIDGWHYDNVKVPRNGFTLRQVESVLQPFLGAVTANQVRGSWQDAVTLTHQAVVDKLPLAGKPEGYCVGLFKIKLNEFAAKNGVTVAGPVNEAEKSG